MYKSVLVAVLIGGLLIGGSVWYRDAGSGATAPTVYAALVDVPVTIYHSPTCGCCGVYARELSATGAQVTTEEVDEVRLSEIKATHDLAINQQSCHTSYLTVGEREYVVEGHVPFAALEKLVTEQPDIAGITLPGMPIGTPGMPGLQSEPYVVETFAGDIFWQS
jgi:hypothetical protein